MASDSGGKGLRVGRLVCGHERRGHRGCLLDVLAFPSDTKCKRGGRRAAEAAEKTRIKSFFSASLGLCVLRVCLFRSVGITIASCLILRTPPGGSSTSVRRITP